MNKFATIATLAAFIAVASACDMSKLNGCWTNSANTFCKHDDKGNNYCNVYYQQNGQSQSFCQSTPAGSASYYSTPVNDGTCPRCSSSCLIYKDCSGGSDTCNTCRLSNPNVPTSYYCQAPLTPV